MKQHVDCIVEALQVVTCAPGNAPKRGKALDDVAALAPGALAIRDGAIFAVGPPDAIHSAFEAREHVRHGGVVTPGLVDAHTHPVFSGSRLDEFLMRAQGATYQEIHAKGGGILRTVEATRRSTPEELEESARRVLLRMLLHGTTTVEAKSGYGLTLEDELKSLRVLKSLAGTLPLDIAPTFMGAHAIPPEHRADRCAYVKLVVSEMIPAVAAERLAEFVDVFCEEGAFTLDETGEILAAARAAGLGIRVHADEFTSFGGVGLSVSLGAASCDHLLAAGDREIALLARSDTAAVLMPGTAFFLAKPAYAPARRFIEAGATVALGTDFNAGSCMTESMAMTMSLAVLHMKMTPAEALSAATVNAACSLGRGARTGSLEPGKQADFLLLDIDDYREWPYHFGVNLVKDVYTKGRRVDMRLLP